MPTQHAVVGGSAYSRIKRCPGSVRLVATLPHGPAGPAADRGTMLHRMAGLMIRSGARAEELVGSQYVGQVLTSIDARTALLPAVDAYRRFIGMAKGVTLEVKVRHAVSVWGTADILGRHKGVGLVGDFKFGAGAVEVKGNDQLMFYASAALVSGKLPKQTPVVRMAIIQPGARPTLQEDEASARQLRDFAAEVREVAKVALSDDAPLIPGDKQCQWCPAGKAGICKARNAQRAAAAPDLATALLTLTR